jgi:hypothetical protein
MAASIDCLVALTGAGTAGVSGVGAGYWHTSRGRGYGSGRVRGGRHRDHHAGEQDAPATAMTRLVIRSSLPRPKPWP